MKNTNHSTAEQLAVIGQQQTDTQILTGDQEQSRAGGSSEEMREFESADLETQTTQVATNESTRQIWINKLLFTLISLKFWGLVASMAVTTWLLIHRYQGIATLVEKGVDPRILENMSIGITGAQWITFNVTIWTMLYGIKEVRKVAAQTKESGV